MASISSFKIGHFLTLWLLVTAGGLWSVESSRNSLPQLSPRCSKPRDCIPNCPHCIHVMCLNTWCVCGCTPPSN